MEGSGRQVRRMGGVECFPGDQAKFKGNTMANREPLKIATNVQSTNGPRSRATTRAKMFCTRCIACLRSLATFHTTLSALHRPGKGAAGSKNQFQKVLKTSQVLLCHGVGGTWGAGKAREGHET